MTRLLYLVLVFATSARAVVTGWSMYPALASGEYVLFNRLAYLRRLPTRGDVVLVRGPLGKRMPLVKRVAGVPGDTVRPNQEWVTANETSAEGAPSTGETEHSEHAPRLLGEDEFFLLGDAGEMSTDSRSFGPVSRKAVKGRAWLVYWPLSRWRSLETE